MLFWVAERDSAGPLGEVVSLNSERVDSSAPSLVCVCVWGGGLWGGDVRFEQASSSSGCAKGHSLSASTTLSLRTPSFLTHSFIAVVIVLIFESLLTWAIVLTSPGSGRSHAIR